VKNGWCFVSTSPTYLRVVHRNSVVPRLVNKFPALYATRNSSSVSILSQISPVHPLPSCFCETSYDITVRDSCLVPTDEMHMLCYFYSPLCVRLVTASSSLVSHVVDLPVIKSDVTWMLKHNNVNQVDSFSFLPSKRTNDPFRLPISYFLTYVLLAFPLRSLPILSDYLCNFYNPRDFRPTRLDKSHTNGWSILSEQNKDITLSKMGKLSVVQDPIYYAIDFLFSCVCCFICKHWGDWGAREAILASFLSQVSPMRGADKMLTTRKLYLTLPVCSFLIRKVSKESHHIKE